MVSKTKSTSETVNELAQQAGLALMAAAVTLGMIEVPDHQGKIVIPNQPALTFAGENSEPTNTLRREREETGPHYTSYNVAQRTPGRTGKI